MIKIKTHILANVPYRNAWHDGRRLKDLVGETESYCHIYLKKLWCKYANHNISIPGGYFPISGQWGCAAGWGRIINGVSTMGSHISDFWGKTVLHIYG